MIQDIAKLKDSGIRTDNQLKLIADKWGVTIPEMMNMINESVTIQKDNEKSDNTKWNVIWIIGFGITLTICIVYAMNLVKKRSYKKDLLGGAYKYRR